MQEPGGGGGGAGPPTASPGSAASLAQASRILGNDRTPTFPAEPCTAHHKHGLQTSAGERRFQSGTLGGPTPPPNPQGSTCRAAALPCRRRPPGTVVHGSPDSLDVVRKPIHEVLPRNFPFWKPRHSGDPKFHDGAPRRESFVWAACCGGGSLWAAGISGLFRGASRRANPRLAPRVRPHPPRGPGARRGRMGPEVGPAFQRRYRESYFSNLGVRFREFAPRCGPPRARAPGAQMIRLASGSSLAFQRLSRDTPSSNLGVRLAQTS
eukprot:gene20954-biopygen5627